MLTSLVWSPSVFFWFTTVWLIIVDNRNERRVLCTLLVCHRSPCLFFFFLIQVDELGWPMLFLAVFCENVQVLGAPYFPRRISFPVYILTNTNNRSIDVNHQVSVYFPCHKQLLWDAYFYIRRTFVLCNVFIHKSNSNISETALAKTIKSRDCLPCSEVQNQKQLSCASHMCDDSRCPAAIPTPFKHLKHLLCRMGTWRNF